jgi:hypothetical protein
MQPMIQKETGQYSQPQKESVTYSPQYTQPTMQKQQPPQQPVQGQYQPSQLPTQRPLQQTTQPPAPKTNETICTLGENMTLNDEPGIAELETLYFDDKYDFETGKFKGMSESTKRVYEADVHEFYRVFTGNMLVPPEIQTFRDIPLKAAVQPSTCSNSKNQTIQQMVPVQTADRSKNMQSLLKKYASILRKMVVDTTADQDQLLGIINTLFAYIVHPSTGKRQVRINPSLTEKGLANVSARARGLIMDLYIHCQSSYMDAAKVYEAIVEQKILETSANQIRNLQREEDKLRFG